MQNLGRYVVKISCASLNHPLSFLWFTNRMAYWRSSGLISSNSLFTLNLGSQWLKSEGAWVRFRCFCFLWLKVLGSYTSPFWSLRDTSTIPCMDFPRLHFPCTEELLALFLTHLHLICSLIVVTSFLPAFSPALCISSPGEWIKISVGSRSKEGILPLCSAAKPPVVLWPPLASATQEIHGRVRAGTNKAMKIGRGLKHLPYGNRLRELDYFGLAPGLLCFLFCSIVSS